MNDKPKGYYPAFVQCNQRDLCSLACLQYKHYVVFFRRVASPYLDRLLVIAIYNHTF